MMLEHPFFQLSGAEQNRFQRNLALAAAAVLLVSGGLLYMAGLLPLIFIIFAIGLSILAPFFDVPGLVRRGQLRYCSPFLLCEAERNGRIVLHAGTLFDFWFLFTKDMSAGERKRRVLTGMLDGLIELIEHHEANDPDRDGEALTVRTTSYILDERNANTLGLEKQPTDALQTIILYYNYFNLTASYSLLHRRLRFPSVRSVQTFEGRMDSLIAKKAELQKLRARLARTPRS